MRIDQLALALSFLEGGELSPYWLLQPVAQGIAEGPAPLPLHQRSLKSTSVHPLGVWTLQLGITRRELADWQEAHLNSFCGTWWRLFLNDFGMLMQPLGFSELELSVLCGLVLAAPFVTFKGRHWGRGTSSQIEGRPLSVPADVSVAWDAAIRAELAAHFRRTVALAAHIGGR